MKEVTLDGEYYQLSSEEIQSGDWVYNPYGNFITLAVGDTYWFSIGFYKVVGSTKPLHGVKYLEKKIVKTQFT